MRLGGVAVWGRREVLRWKARQRRMRTVGRTGAVAERQCAWAHVGLSEPCSPCFLVMVRGHRQPTARCFPLADHHIAPS